MISFQMKPMLQNPCIYFLFGNAAAPGLQGPIFRGAARGVEYWQNLCSKLIGSSGDGIGEADLHMKEGCCAEWLGAGLPHQPVPAQLSYLPDFPPFPKLVGGCVIPQGRYCCSRTRKGVLEGICASAVGRE